MDFSLLSVPFTDILQDGDSNDKQTAGCRVDGNHEENIAIQVFCLIICNLSTKRFWIEMYRIQQAVKFIVLNPILSLWYFVMNTNLYNMSKIFAWFLPALLFSECWTLGSMCEFSLGAVM